MTVWRIRRKIIRTVLFCVVYNACEQRHTNEQLLPSTVHLGLIFVCFCQFCSCDFAFAVLGLVSSVLSQEIDCKEHLQSDHLVK